MSQWSDVPSGIPQGSILGPVLLIIYIKDLIESRVDDAKIYLFADDARLYNHIECKVNAEILQSKNDKFTNWAHTWLVKLSTKKCKLVSFHQCQYNTTNDSFTYKIDGVPLQQVKSYKDLKVLLVCPEGIAFGAGLCFTADVLFLLYFSNISPSSMGRSR